MGLAKNGGGGKYPKTQNICVIKHKHWVLCISFEEKSAQTKMFSNTTFSMKENQFLVHGTENEFTSVFMHLSFLEYVIIIFLRVRHQISL